MLDFFFWVVMNCSSVTTCKVNADAEGKNFTIVMCTTPGNPISENEKRLYRREMVEQDTGRKLTVYIDNCVQV